MAQLSKRNSINQEIKAKQTLNSTYHPAIGLIRGNKKEHNLRARS